MTTRLPCSARAGLSLLLLLAAAARPAPLAAQQAGALAPALANVGGRAPVSLNGAWRIIVDPFETGYLTYRWTPDANGYFRDRKAASPAERVEYDFDRAPTLQAPPCGPWTRPGW